MSNKPQITTLSFHNAFIAVLKNITHQRPNNNANNDLVIKNYHLKY